MTQLIIKMIKFMCLKLSPTLSCLVARRWKCAMTAPSNSVPLPVFTVEGLGREGVRGVIDCDTAKDEIEDYKSLTYRAVLHTHIVSFPSHCEVF